MTGTLHQASAVAIDGAGVLIEGPPGVGKSSLALALIDRGAALIGDDGILLAVRAGRLVAAPAPAIAGRLEIRNVGIVTMPATSAPVALLLRLDPDAPRHVEHAEPALRNGCPVPAIALWPGSPVLALRAEWALRLWGCPAITG